MDLSTTYLGKRLRSPLVASASPLTKDLDKLKRLEEAGAGAVVLPSLFEEQIRREQLELHHHLSAGTESFPEALSYFPEPDQYRVGAEEYLALIQRAKRSLTIPVIASLNGMTLGGWTEYAVELQKAGADAIELNIYFIPTDPDVGSSEIEKTYLDILEAVKAVVTVPVAVKLSPYFTNLANMAMRFDERKVDGLVLFNRFYQPDINLEAMEVEPHILLSTPMAMRLPLRWIAILSGRLDCDLAATSGIHWAPDVIKVILAGASVAMMCSSLIRHGIDHLTHVESELRQWMEQHGYDSIDQMRGSLNQKHCEHPTEFERAQYIKALTTFRAEHFAKFFGS